MPAFRRVARLLRHHAPGGAQAGVHPFPVLGRGRNAGPSTGGGFLHFLVVVVTGDATASPFASGIGTGTILFTLHGHACSPGAAGPAFPGGRGPARPAETLRECCVYRRPCPDGKQRGGERRFPSSSRRSFRHPRKAAAPAAAVAKKSASPKFPDFRASERSLSSVRTQGTPGAICGPM